MASTPVVETIPTANVVRNEKEVKKIMRDYLQRSMTPSDHFCLAEAYQRSAKLSKDIFGTVSDFIKAAGDDQKLAEKLSIWAGDVAGSLYTHTSPEHQQYIALYISCMAYADDLGCTNVEALAQFSRRFTTGEKQLSPPLDLLAGLLKQAYDLWQETDADAIVSCTLVTITAMHLECTTGDMAAIPQATMWPNYFRSMTGFASAMAHFNFTKGWRSKPDSYMQLLPYLEFFINGSNDVLSFYKEELCGETANYVHIRATTDEQTLVDTLRVLADETLACEEKIGLLIGDDPELMAIWRSFEQGYLAFHMKNPRYHLAELTLPEEH